MPTFTTTFTPPAAPSGFLLEADVDASAVRLEWDSSSIPQVDFAGFRVYRSLDNGLTFLLLATYELVSEVEHVDYNAPLNVPLLYRLTQSNLDFESEPAEGSVELVSSRPQVVVPGDLGLTFSIAKWNSLAMTTPKTQDEFRPIGRPGALVIGDVVHAETGVISFLAMPDNLGMVALVRAIMSRMEGGILLKLTDGTVLPVQYGAMSRTFTSWGGQEISIPFTGVG